MDTPPQPTEDDAIDALLEQARQFVLGLILYIDGIFARLNGAPLSERLARHLMRHALIPAEIALRRAIFILAADLPPQPMPTRKPPAKAPSRPSQSREAPAAKPPGFRMAEPAKRKASGYASASQLPRISFPGDASDLRAPTSWPRPVAETFARRLSALHVAFDNALPLAKRWARRMASRLARRLARKGAAKLLPATAPRLPKSVPEEARDLIRELTDFAHQGFALNSS
ncbi:hypothetical protein K1X12_09920 [Hyphomonas sp. WL0036]|uniref:hypothetical protein n=1 Tax=Hyphomonas sediminis TaxID=2866160 RepID=UPI001C7F834F|nr:hypothetical protein [Hyphomonas sediminis]MBY9067216.1 hypothetical protein [Hyphomonas sediminis]